MLRVVFYWRVGLLMVFGLMFLVSSCDKGEWSDNDKPVGDWGPVSINLQGISEGNAENLSRSSGADFTPVTETVALGDGLLMEMSLEPDPAAELRADPEPLGDGKKFVLIAVTATEGKYLSHAEYTMDGSAPVSNDSVTVPWGWNCRFICVSLNSTESPLDYAAGLTFGATPSFNDIPNTVDLLYWSQIENNITADKLLDITLRHKFNSVIVKVDCTYNEWNIESIAADGIKMNTYSTLTMNVVGDVSSETDTTRSVSWPAITPAQIQESRGDTIYLSKLDIALAANALRLSTFGDAPSVATTAKFSSATFTPGGGNRYVLTLKVKQTMFASSNIYWDGKSLTFKAYSATPGDIYGDTVKYQGVYFKFGSLVGISPQGDFAPASTPLYVPRLSVTPVATDTFYVTTASPASNHPAWSDTVWTAIPYVSHGAIDPLDRSNRYVSHLPADTFKLMRGDICRYLEFINAAPPRPRSELHWYLPASAEFGLNNDYWAPAAGWQKVGTFTTASSNKADGTYKEITWGGAFGITNNFFPTSGYRVYSNGSLADVGVYGTYWSSSVDINTTNGCYLTCAVNEVFPISRASRQYAWPVRCVLRE
jgi:hypothetical protein